MPLYYWDLPGFLPNVINKKVLARGQYTFGDFRLNERKVSLVVICTVILVVQRLSSEEGLCPSTDDAPGQLVGGCIVFSYGVVITKSSIVLYVEHTVQRKHNIV